MFGVNGVRTLFEQAANMSDERTAEWLTYEQAAERLGVTPEAVRQKAIRGRWHRSRGNDGKARVRLPEGRPDAVRTPSERASANAVRTPSERVSAERLFAAMNDHVETLKRDLAALTADLAAARSDLLAAAAAASTEREKAARELAAAQARIAEIEAQISVERGKVDDERRRADAAIASHLDLAERVAADRARPWWRRLVG